MGSYFESWSSRTSLSINIRMQILPVYLYPNTLEVILDLDDTIKGANQVMYQRDLKIQKGIKNQVRVQFKNSDQKRITISNSGTYVFTMFDIQSQKLVTQKTLEVLDTGTVTTRGLALLSLEESDTVDLDKSAYQYSVTYMDEDGTYLPAYTNTYYGMAGTMYLNNDVYPVLQPSQEIVSFLRSYNASSSLYEHKSGNVDAHPEYKKNSALHTAALYMTGFRGTVYIQATLNNTPDSFGRYATVFSKTYTGFTGVDYANFNGIFNYIRVMYVPAVKPGDSANDDPTYFGSFDKVLYRS
jgi:hypothetical protein